MVKAWGEKACMSVYVDSCTYTSVWWVFLLHPSVVSLFLQSSRCSGLRLQTARCWHLLGGSSPFFQWPDEKHSHPGNTICLSLLLQCAQGHTMSIHWYHHLSRLRLPAAQPVWLMLAQKGSTWRMPVTVEPYWGCRRRTGHGALCPFPRTTTRRIRLRWSESRPSTHPQRGTQWSQMTDCSGWEFFMA